MLLVADTRPRARRQPDRIRWSADPEDRPAELAALLWDDPHDGLLTIEIVSSGADVRDFRAAATKTANTRWPVRDRATKRPRSALRRRRLEPSGERYPLRRMDAAGVTSSELAARPPPQFDTMSS